MHYALCFLVLLSSGVCSAQAVYPNAHAHNDYEHARPLFDALQNGFTSVEADIHLIDGELYVAHGRPRPSAGITLQALYLNPLDSLRKLNAGIYKDYDKPIVLLIDIKTDATRTLTRVIEVMNQYPALFPSGAAGSLVQVVISGNRDYELILKTDGVFIDGRPDDLDKGFSGDKMPLISDHFSNWMHWNGKGAPEAIELQKVRDLANRVHKENKRLRLWAIPDREEAWQVLMDAGVDLINTDRLDALNQFLSGEAVQNRK